MINKPVIKLAIQSIEPLNKPDWAEYNLTRIKVASIDKSKDLAGFDLEAARKEHPDHLFVKVFAIRENEVNDNGDAFSKSELQKAYQTFVGVPIFTNHQNDDVEKAKGKCVHSWYDEKKGGIYIISMIDKVAYPRLARGIAEKYIAGSSMGAAVDYSCCSICHNKSNVADEYCEHIRNQKSRKISAVVPCKYHESKGEPKDDCPVCGQTYSEYKVGSVNKFKHSESQVYEWNYGIKFIEDSFVVNPACHDCLVQDILNPDAVNRKIADIMEKLDKMKKVASCTTGCNLEKFAGEKELNFLEEAMNKIIVVSKSLMAQNKQVSMEYVSNLVDVLANLQTTADELTEMGYGELPSPDPSAVESMEVPSEEELTEQTEQPAPEQQPQGSAMQPQVPPAGQPVVTQPAPGVMTEQFGDLGSVTKPKFSSVVRKKKEDFLQASAIIVDKLEELQEKYTEMENIHKKENSTMSDTRVYR